MNNKKRDYLKYIKYYPYGESDMGEGVLAIALEGESFYFEKTFMRIQTADDLDIIIRNMKKIDYDFLVKIWGVSEEYIYS